MNAKKRWMLSASVACCGLIALFLGLWLSDQYKMERFRLRKTAGDDVNLTVEKVTEKMMFDLLQRPLETIHLPDSMLKTGRTLHIKKTQLPLSSQRTTVSIVVRNSDTVLHDPAQGNPQKRRIFLQNVDSVRQEVTFLEKDLDHVDSEVNGLFSKGLKVFVNQLAEVKSNGDITKVTHQQLDTAAFSKQLRAHWSNKKMGYEVHYNDRKKPGRNELRVQVFDKPVRIMLTDLRSNAFKAIVPQLFFAVSLLFVLCASFVWMYRSWKKQVELNTLRMDFMHNMTHELKTPVSTVKVALEVLNRYSRREDPKVVAEYLQLMEHEINRLDTLVDNVMNNSWAEAKELPISKSQVNVGNELTAFVERLRAKDNWKAATLFLELPQEEIVLKWDAFHMEGVLNNLADNALKYAGPEVKLTIALSKAKNTVTILFADNGPGIPENYRDEVFRPFVRVPQGNVHNVKGNGLGLSYCRKVMEAHNGTIRYLGERSGGAGFELQLNGE